MITVNIHRRDLVPFVRGSLAHSLSRHTSLLFGGLVRVVIGGIQRVDLAEGDLKILILFVLLFLH
jgi:hypothetical protein